MTDLQILEAAKLKIGDISPEKLTHEFIQVPVEWMEELRVCWVVVTFKKSVEDGKIVWRESNTFKSL